VFSPALFNGVGTILCVKETSAKIGQMNHSPLPMMLSAPWHPILQFHDHLSDNLYLSCLSSLTRRGLTKDSESPSDVEVQNLVSLKFQAAV